MSESKGAGKSRGKRTGKGDGSAKERAGEFPVADVRSSSPPIGETLRQFHTRFWWVTAVCALVAIALVVSATGGGGPTIHVLFRQGHGIKPDDTLRYRGTQVGRVTAVSLGEDLSAVEVEIELDPTAAGVAREGSRFWIERPQVSLSRVRGLETVVGAKYVGVLPGPGDGPVETVFEGLETPPALQDTGDEVLIRFREGHGLAAGDLVRYRGIVVGEVGSVRLSDGHEGVEVRVRLVSSAQRLARAGTLFWIERPRVSLTGVQGLDTLVGGRYIAVLPGPEEAEALAEFDGLDRAPASGERQEGGLEIILESTHRSSLERGSPVTYRGVQVGHIVSVGLSTDAVKVEARAFIRPEFIELIREETKFWSTSGIQADIGWTGVRVAMDSLTTIAAGGVSLATPYAGGQRVMTGHPFPLHDTHEEEWLQWQPRLPLGSSLLPEGLSLPQPLRASLRWSEKTLGFRTTKQREGWVLPLQGGWLLGPAELFTIPEDAADGTARLELAGQEFPISPGATAHMGPLAAYLVGAPSQPGRPWPLERIRHPEGPEDCLLLGDPQAESVPLSTGRMAPVEIVGRSGSDGAGGRVVWEIDASLSLDPDWHGAAVLSRRDGRLIGVLLCGKGRARVVPVTKDEIRR